jgi:hypothetical protein
MKKDCRKRQRDLAANNSAKPAAGYNLSWAFVANASNSTLNESWVLDSGCSRHMTGTAKMLTNLRSAKISISAFLADGRFMASDKIGTTIIHSGAPTISVQNVYLVLVLNQILFQSNV